MDGTKRSILIMLSLMLAAFLAGCTDPEEGVGDDDVGIDPGTGTDAGDQGGAGTGTDGTDTGGDGTGAPADTGPIQNIILIDSRAYSCNSTYVSNLTMIDGGNDTDAGGEGGEEPVCPAYELSDQANATAGDNATAEGNVTGAGSQSYTTEDDGTVMIDGNWYECETAGAGGDAAAAEGGAEAETSADVCERYVLMEDMGGTGASGTS